MHLNFKITFCWISRDFLVVLIEYNAINSGPTNFNLDLQRGSRYENQLLHQSVEILNKQFHIIPIRYTSLSFPL